MTLYLLVILAATLVVPLGWPGALRNNWGVVAGFMAVPGVVAIAGGLLLSRRSRPSPLIWPLAALAMGRTLAAIVAGFSSPFMFPHTLAAWAGPAAFLAAQARRKQIPGAMRALGPALAGLAVGQAMMGMHNVCINRNVLGAALALCLAAFLPGIEGKQRSRIVSGALVALGLLATGSRGGIAAGVVVVSVYFGLYRQAIPVLAAAIPLLLQLRNPAALTLRWGYWLDAIAAWWRSPWWGIGPQHLPGGAMHAHNLVLGVLVWSGLVGVGVVAWGCYRARGAWRGAPRWALAGLAGAAVHGLVEDLTIFPLIVALVVVLLAGAASSSNHSESPRHIAT